MSLYSIRFMFTWLYAPHLIQLFSVNKSPDKYYTDGMRVQVLIVSHSVNYILLNDKFGNHILCSFNFAWLLRMKIIQNNRIEHVNMLISSTVGNPNDKQILFRAIRIDFTIAQTINTYIKHFASLVNFLNSIRIYLKTCRLAKLFRQNGLQMRMFYSTSIGYEPSLSDCDLR